ncbi:hypothetical protein AVEN_165639-1, partial [Araneus ventricosus]
MFGLVQMMKTTPDPVSTLLLLLKQLYCYLGTDLVILNRCQMSTPELELSLQTSAPHHLPSIPVDSRPYG